MPIEPPRSDLARSVQHDPTDIWPESVKIQLLWTDSSGRPVVRTQVISADQFFGLKGFGAPLSGDWLISYIERMRKAGPPVKLKREPKQKVVR